MAFDWESKPPMFIICSPRSGSTLLRLLLNTHSKISIPPPGFMYAHFHTFMHTYGDLEKDENLRTFVEDVVEFHQQQSLECHIYGRRNPRPRTRTKSSRCEHGRP